MKCSHLLPTGRRTRRTHDENRPGESELEEIYYFEVASGPAGPGIAYQRVYGTKEWPIDLLAEVRSGDVVLVPHGGTARRWPRPDTTFTT